ncbi:sigma factor-like helix-turn-helix DNA-binding protein [Caulobacter sp.]|uniref:sigma factor-like helix-turn-helix DNA-binding protein n=1 Tax=Caulobacter sp. TaxID=78 RepID=UPI001AFE69D0|nr:sigma-70 family RNA polymerase sigma factor [Caulobacter sp.]
MPGLALRLRRPWWTHQSQLWRLRHPHLWPGGSFDRADQASTIKYALLRLPEAERDVFVLNRFRAWDYLQIGRHLGLTAEEVETRFAAAILRLFRIVDFIESLEPNP